MNKFIVFNLLTMVLINTGCTFNVSMAHTEGSATDVIDDTASNSPDVSPTISIPAAAL